MTARSLHPSRRTAVAIAISLLLVAAVAIVRWPGGAAAGPSAGSGNPDMVARPFAQLQEAPAADEALPVPESPAFDRGGDLYWVTVWGYQGFSLFRLDMDSRQSEGVAVSDPADPDWAPAFVAIAFHRDGSLYAADFAGQRIVRIDTRTWTSTDVVTRADTGAETFYPDDLAFDRQGNLYITDLQGDVTDPKGKVYRYSTAGRLSVVADRLAAPNGVALSPDEHQLWVSEYHANRLLRMDLAEDGGVVENPYFRVIEVIANFSGPGLPDSLKVDADNNLYQAFYRGGRLQVVSEYGDHLADVTLAGGPEDYRQTTNLVIEPRTRNAYLIAGGEGGARLYSFRALGRGPVPFSHS
jgi:lactonase